eukprot:s1547_g10.t1
MLCCICAGCVCERACDHRRRLKLDERFVFVHNHQSDLSEDGEARHFARDAQHGFADSLCLGGPCEAADDGRVLAPPMAVARSSRCHARKHRRPAGRPSAGGRRAPCGLHRHGRHGARREIPPFQEFRISFCTAPRRSSSDSCGQLWRKMRRPLPAASPSNCCRVPGVKFQSTLSTAIRQNQHGDNARRISLRVRGRKANCLSSSLHIARRSAMKVLPSALLHVPLWIERFRLKPVEGSLQHLPNPVAAWRTVPRASALRVAAEEQPRRAPGPSESCDTWLSQAAREKAGLERKKCRGKAKSEDKAAQHALADEVLEEELVPVENEDAMDFAAETSADGVAEAITHVGDLVDKMVAEAERKAELALEEAEMAAAEAESYERELEKLLKELGV